MSTTIAILQDTDALQAAVIAEVPTYWTEITADQARAFATLIDQDGRFFTYVDDHDIFVDTMPLCRLSDDQLTAVRAIFAGSDAAPLVEQIIARQIKVSVTEALGLGHGRYMLSRVCEPADEISMNLSGGNFSALWSRLGFAALNSDECCGEVDLDKVEAALDDNGQFVSVNYVTGLRDLIAYGRSVGATQLYWA